MNDGENYWNAFRSHKRSATDGPTLSPWMITALQATKLLLFAMCNIVLTLGSVFSELIVLIMATNILPHTQVIGKFSRKCSEDIERRTSTTTAGIYLSLMLIQCFPDTVNLNRLSLEMHKGRCGRLIRSVVIIESLRAIGLAVLSFHVFPQLDLARCLVLSACFPLVAVLQRSLIAMMSAFKNRLGRCFIAIPHVLMFLILMSSCYVWTLFDGKFTATIALPIGVICTSIGFWESWIVTIHAGTTYDELYRLKYAIILMNNTTNAVVAVTRIICTVFVMVAAVFMDGHTELNASHFIKAFFSFHTKQHYTRLLLLSCSIIALHSFMRVISRFLAALDLHPFSFVHPLSIAPLIAYGYVRYVCQSPTCFIARCLSRFGLRWVCDQWFQENQTMTSPDFYICIIWLLVGCFCDWLLARQICFDKNGKTVLNNLPALIIVNIGNSLNAIDRMSLGKVSQRMKAVVDTWTSQVIRMKLTDCWTIYERYGEDQHVEVFQEQNSNALALLRSSSLRLESLKLFCAEESMNYHIRRMGGLNHKIHAEAVYFQSSFDTTQEFLKFLRPESMREVSIVIKEQNTDDWDDFLQFNPYLQSINLLIIRTEVSPNHFPLRGISNYPNLAIMFIDMDQSTIPDFMERIMNIAQLRSCNISSNNTLDFDMVMDFFNEHEAMDPEFPHIRIYPIQGTIEYYQIRFIRRGNGIIGIQRMQ